MANTLTLTANIAIPNAARMKIGRVTELDEDNKRMVVEMTVGSVGFSTLFPNANPLRLEITNGACDGLAAHPAPAVTTDAVISVRLGGAGVAAAFDTCLTAYRAAGADKRGNLMTAMQGISGVVSGGPLNGTTQPMLPPGTVA
jgi:hypothetical protein